ncbi:MAG: dihydrodipicolinate synthase family protein [Acidobacteria bacterium]|nr:MAG: dihydrodipicolinate synthase family protein [Acidobacteriota bacterium]
MQGIELSGIIPPLATPLTEQADLDCAALERLVEHVIQGGVSGMFLLGTTGEGPHLDPGIRFRMIKAVCKLAAGRVPVLVGLCDSSTSACLRIADQAAAEGASALVLTPPFYFPLSQEELLHYLERLVPQLPLPVFLYNIPSLTKIWVQPPTLLKIVANLPISGLKDSSGDMEYFAEVRRALPRATGFQLFCGPEEKLMEAVRLGADGGVCGGANLFPRLYVELFRSACAGFDDRAEHLQSEVRKMSEVVYSQTPDGSSYLRGLKSALEIVGICDGWLAEPLAPLDSPLRENIRRFLETFAWRNNGSPAD